MQAACTLWNNFGTRLCNRLPFDSPKKNNKSLSEVGTSKMYSHYLSFLQYSISSHRLLQNQLRHHKVLN